MEQTDISYALYDFAFCGPEESFSGWIETLAKMAEPEIWTFDESRPNSILRTYIFKTFEQCNRQGKILYSDDKEWCTVNTGLLTPNSKDILMVFMRNRKVSNLEWFFKGFKEKVDREYMNHFSQTPELATYTDDFEDYIFNPNLNIEVNTDHILDDNWERISAAIGSLSKTVVSVLLQGGSWKMSK